MGRRSAKPMSVFGKRNPGADGPLVIGTAKELCEAIAKVVVAERGGTLSGAADLPDVVTAAHKALEFQPGEGVANDPETRKVAQGLKSIVLGLGELRNRRGTGHGRATPGNAVEEHVDLAYEARERVRLRPQRFTARAFAMPTNSTDTSKTRTSIVVTSRNDF